MCRLPHLGEGATRGCQTGRWAAAAAAVRDPCAMRRKRFSSAEDAKADVTSQPQTPVVAAPTHTHRLTHTPSLAVSPLSNPPPSILSIRSILGIVGGPSACYVVRRPKFHSHHSPSVAPSALRWGRRSAIPRQPILSLPAGPGFDSTPDPPVRRPDMLPLPQPTSPHPASSRPVSMPVPCLHSPDPSASSATPRFACLPLAAIRQPIRPARWRAEGN